MEPTRRAGRNHPRFTPRCRHQENLRPALAVTGKRNRTAIRAETVVIVATLQPASVHRNQPGRSQVNYIGAAEPDGDIVKTRKREHSRKPDEQYQIIESCSPGRYLELFARGERKNWTVWGNQADDTYKPDWETYKYNSSVVNA